MSDSSVQISLAAKDPFLEAEEPVDLGGSSNLQIENLVANDPFADDDTAGGKAQDSVHIRIQQRNGRKTLTTVQGLPEENLDFKKILKYFKHEFKCNGTIIDAKDQDMGKVIQLQGDHRKEIKDFLTSKKKSGLGKFALDEKRVKVHGF